MFLQKSKIQTVGKRKNRIQLFNSRNAFFFLYWLFSENTQSLVGEHLQWLLLKIKYASAANLLHTRKEILDWNESYVKETKHIHASDANLLQVRIVNLYWYKCRHCKNETREIDCLCCREVDPTHIALAKIPEREGSISPCSCYG